MKIALGQMEVAPNRPEKNLETMLEMIERAKAEQVDLIAFPEMAIGGYLLGDKWLDDSFCLDLMKFNEKLRSASHGIAIAYGNVFVDSGINERVADSNYHPNKDGRSRKYNAVYVFQNGQPVPRAKETNILPEGVQPKALLPNYRFFDDERYFFSLQDIAHDFGVPIKNLAQPFLIDVNGRKVPVGFELCEDLWCEDYRLDGSALNITKLLIENGAESIVNLSSSPWTYGKNSARDRRVLFLKRESGHSFVPFYYVNNTGAQNNGKNVIVFDGGSTIYNSEGLPVFFSKSPYKEELIVTSLDDIGGKALKRTEKPRIAQKYDAIITGIRHMKVMMGAEQHPNFAVGLSGGIDSAVTAALISLAVGPEKVFAINMPTSYNSTLTQRTAEKVARNLGINYEVHPAGDLSELTKQLIERQRRQLTDLQYGNAMAKQRAVLLSTYAAAINGVFTNNGNKLEVALGYTTLYGDLSGAIAPIADLTKAEVYEMGRYLNLHVFKQEVTPEILFPDRLFRFRKNQVVPSAELEQGQIDPMKFGYHDALLEAMTDFKKKSTEDIMQWYIEGTLERNLNISAELIKRWGIDEPRIFVKDLEWFAGCIDKSVYKRVQAPPIIILSKSAYGYDIRESQLPLRFTAKHQELKQKILGMESYRTAGIDSVVSAMGVAA